MQESQLTYDEIQQLESITERLSGKITYLSTYDQSGKSGKKIVIVYDKDSDEKQC